MLVALTLLTACALSVAASSKEEKQAEARKKANETLERLYKAQPSARAAVKSAAGYAVFTSKSMKILLGGGAEEKASPSTTPIIKSLT